MPTYDYRCTKGHVFELFHSMTDEKPRRCPRCGARARRVPSGGAGLLFKGSGFYITDYRSTSYQEKAKAERPASGESAKSTAGEAKKKPGEAKHAPTGETRKSPGAPRAPEKRP
jgi:putative FmdB family regulatory protein